MADYKKVFQMLGENPASFLELTKKLLVDWGIDPKKLLTLIHNFRKEDLLGLLAGTHEIKPKEKQAQLVAAENEYFEQILETDYITVPDMATVATYAKEKWSKEMGSVTPSNVLVAGQKKKVKVFCFKKRPVSQQCVDFIKSLPGAILPNVYGLAVAEMTVGSQLPKDKWILGFDNRDNLSVYALGVRRVPGLYLDSDGSVNRGWDSWGDWDGDWDVEDFCLVVLCD